MLRNSRTPRSLPGCGFCVRQNAATVPTRGIEGEVNMDLKWCAAGLGAVVIAVTAVAGPPADAAQKKKGVVVTEEKRVVFVNRPRTRITVRPRSFLDGGTEVIPGDRKFMDYAVPAGISPASNIGMQKNAIDRSLASSLAGTFHMTSRQNPLHMVW